MSVYYYEPFFSFSDLSRLMDDTMSRMSSSSQQMQMMRNSQSGEVPMMRAFTPKVDIHENAEQNRVVAMFELPGVSKDSISMNVQNGRLIVSGEQMLTKDMNENGFVLRERQMGRFSRTLPLPMGMKPQDVQAKMENGILMVSFPKMTQEQQPQMVPIQ